MSMEIEIVI